MLLVLGIPPGYYEFTIVLTLSVVVVISYLIFGLWYSYKSRVIEKGSPVPILCLLLVILTPILASLIPGGGSIISSRTDFALLTLILLWFLGISTIGFILFLYLVRSKKKILEETGNLRPKTERGRALSYSGLKIGVAIIIVGALVVLLFSIFGLNLIVYNNFLLRILIIIITSLIIIGGIYSLYRKKHATFGSIICVVGGASIIAFSFYLQISTYGFYYYSIMDLIPILAGGPAIIGVILHYAGRKEGSILCVFMGIVNLALAFIFRGYIGGGFLNIYFTIQLEPILMIVGGYFLYKKQLGT